MRVYDQGSCYRVTVSAAEVAEWNRRWPCSSLDGPQSFTFDKINGDLVDHVGRSEDGGGEAVALSNDAQTYGETRLKLTATQPR